MQDDRRKHSRDEAPADDRRRDREHVRPAQPPAQPHAVALFISVDWDEV